MKKEGKYISLPLKPSIAVFLSLIKILSDKETISVTHFRPITINL